MLPNPVRTNLGADRDPPLHAQRQPLPAEALLAAWAATIPLGPLGEAGDIAPRVSFRAHDEAGFVTAAQFVADGGTIAA